MLVCYSNITDSTRGTGIIHFAFKRHMFTYLLDGVLCVNGLGLLDCVCTHGKHMQVQTHTHTQILASSVSSKAARTPEGDQGRFCISLWKRKTVSMSRGRDGMLMKPQKGLFLCACFPSTPFHISGSPQLCAGGVYAGAKTHHINWWHWKENEQQQWVMRESAGLVSLSQGNASNIVIGWNENNQMRSRYRAGAGKGGRTVRSVLCPVSCCSTLPNYDCWRYSYCMSTQLTLLWISW